MKLSQTNLAQEMRFAKSLYGDLPKPVLRALRELAQRLTVEVVGHEAIATRNRQTLAGAGSRDHRREVEAGWPGFSPLCYGGGRPARDADMCLREDLLVHVQG